MPYYFSYSTFCNKPSCIYRLYDIEGRLLYTVRPRMAPA